MDYYHILHLTLDFTTRILLQLLVNFLDSLPHQANKTRDVEASFIAVD